MNDDPFGIGEVGKKIAEELAPKMYEDIGQPAAKTLGRTLGLLAESYLYLPARIHAAKRMARLLPRLHKYSDEIAAIEEQNLCEVPPEIGVPILERLSDIGDNDIADLFIRLLATASSEETINLAHPRFVSLIDSISPDEARILAYLRDKEELWLLRSDSPTEAGAHVDLSTLMFGRRIELKFTQNMSLYFENLRSLGILHPVVESIGFSCQDLQDPVKLHGLQAHGFPEISKEAIASLVQQNLDRAWFGNCPITEFGRMFINACTAKLSSEKIE